MIRVIFYGRKLGAIGIGGLHTRLLQGMNGHTIAEVIARLYETHEHIDHKSVTVEYMGMEQGQ